MGLKGFVDGLGDFFGTSGFAKEAKVWDYLTGVKINRVEYNKNPEEFSFRNAPAMEFSDTRKILYTDNNFKPDFHCDYEYRPLSQRPQIMIDAGLYEQKQTMNYRGKLGEVVKEIKTERSSGDLPKELRANTGEVIVSYLQKNNSYSREYATPIANATVDKINTYKSGMREIARRHGIKVPTSNKKPVFN